MSTFLLVQSSLYIVGNIYIIIRAWQAMASWPLWIKLPIAVLYILFASSFFLVFRVRDMELSPMVAHYIHVIGTTWLLFTFYMLLALLATELLRFFHLYKPNVFFIALGVIVAILIYGYINYKNPKINVLDLTIDKPLITASKQVKVVAVSDVHLGLGTDKSDLKQYVRKINALNPDLILIAGDLVDNIIRPVRTQRMDEELSELKAPLGVFMALGNHEYIGNVDETIDFINTTPIRLLRDEYIELPNGIQLIGRDDRRNQRRRPLSELVNETDASKPIIVIDHQPFNLEEAGKAGVDLQVSGHTHQGQVWPVNLYVNRLFEVSHGYIRKGNAHIFVSSGLSLWGPPFRIGTNSEIVVFNLQFN